jgi:predicted dehydrogenase
MISMRVRWGILGTATIAREGVIPGMRRAPYNERSEVVAIASRRWDRAQEVARAFEIAKAYGSYEALLADAEIDAVYIPLPNHLHVPYAILALEAGKHVLCEKPIGLSASEAQTLADAGRKFPRLKLMEAFMYRHHPQWVWVQRVLSEGQLGEVQTVHSMFSFYDDNPGSILHRAEWGGGALMDIGCYGVSLSRLVFGREPERVLGHLEIDAQFGVDRLTSGWLQFGARSASFTCSTRSAEYQRVTVLGSQGRLELERPFNPPSDESCRGWLERDGQVEEVRFEACDQYGIQADQLARAILEDGLVPVGIDDAVKNMRVIDALVRSSVRGTWERV